MRKKRSAFRKLNDNWLPSQEQDYQSVFWATPDDLLRLSENAGTVSLWSYRFALGNTMKEKSESLFIQLSELTDVLIKKGAAGYFWIAAGSKLCPLLECTPGFEAAEYAYGEYPFDRQYYLGAGLSDRGTVSEKWRLLMCPKFTEDQLLIGVNNKEEHYACYARLKVCDLDV